MNTAFKQALRWLSVIFLTFSLVACSSFWPFTQFSSNLSLKTHETHAKYLLLDESGIVSYSSDAKHWQSLPKLANGRWNNLVVNDNQAFLVGMNGNLAISLDGIAWQILSKNDPRAWLYSMATGASRHVAVGVNGTIVAAYKLDQFMLMPTATSAWLSDVTFAFNERFYAVGSNGTIVSSAYGRFWQTESSPTNAWLSKINYLNQRFLVSGANGTILTSTSGNRWYKQLTPTKNWLYSLAYANGVYLAGGENGTVLISTDASNWSIVTGQFPKNCTIRSIIYANEQFIAVGSNGLIAKSKNGLTWQILDNGNNSNLLAIVYLNSI